ncbi:MAG: eL32 family ribosomal protein [Candidatus Micrarchaeota archaeon]
MTENKYAKIKRVPKFKRQNWDLIKRVRQTGWRKPRGIDNKQRISASGQGALPKIGYGTKTSEKHLHPIGLKEVLVHNASQLKNAGKLLIRIAGGVGNKKKIEIIQEAKKLGLKVLNPKTKKFKSKEVKKEIKKEEVKKEIKAEKIEEKKPVETKEEPKKEKPVKTNRDVK